MTTVQTDFALAPIPPSGCAARPPHSGGAIRLPSRELILTETQQAGDFNVGALSWAQVAAETAKVLTEV